MICTKYVSNLNCCNQWSEQIRMLIPLVLLKLPLNFGTEISTAVIRPTSRGKNLNEPQVCKATPSAQNSSAMHEDVQIK